MEIGKIKQKLWENIGSKYYKNNTTNKSAQFRREFISRIVKQNGINSVLECNSGSNLLYIHKLCPNVKSVGIDICKDALDFGKDVEKNPAELIHKSIYDLHDFKNDSFDLVFTCGVLAHIPSLEIDKIIKNMCRISKKYVFNIELHGENDVPQSYDVDNNPHVWTTNYKSVYSNIGIDMKKIVMATLFPGQKHSVAKHLMIANVNNGQYPNIST